LTQIVAFYLASALVGVNRFPETNHVADDLDPIALAAAEPRNDWTWRRQALNGQIRLLRGDATQAIDCMTRVADRTQDTKQRVESFYRIGKALDEKLGDRVAAQDRYEMALDLDPSHLLTIASLRAIAMDNADYDKAARYIDQGRATAGAAPRAPARRTERLRVMLGDHETPSSLGRPHQGRSGAKSPCRWPST
jgi:tetratricopeptide (TPR) repeat protein